MLMMSKMMYFFKEMDGSWHYVSSFLHLNGLKRPPKLKDIELHSYQRRQQQKKFQARRVVFDAT